MTIHFVLLLCLVPGCSSLFFYPEKRHVDNPEVAQFPYEDVYFRTDDGIKLHAWFFPAEDSSGTVLFLHGNAENISSHVSSVLWMVRSGLNVLAFDYRGYGLSEGEPSLEGVHQDAQAALKVLLSMQQIDRERIIVFGQSIGGAIAVHLVATTSFKDCIRALVIDSAFASYRGIAREKMNQFALTWPFQYPLSWLFNDSFSPARRIEDVSPVPVLIIHGSLDEVVPVHHGERLFQAASEPKKFWALPGVGHIQAVLMPSVRMRLLEYMRLYLQR
jgi:uncharacterized protein